MNVAAAIVAYVIVGLMVVPCSYVGDYRRMGPRVFWANLPAHLRQPRYLQRFAFAALTWPGYVAFLMRRQ